MTFSRVHVYGSREIDVERILTDISTLFPECHVDIREQKVLDPERARISTITEPFHLQPNEHKDFDLYDRVVTLYDGHELQNLVGQTIPEHESSLDHIHIVFTDILTCTFSDEDLRYHARTVICGTPSLISIPGIIEAPAKPREFYFSMSTGLDFKSAKERVADKILDYHDSRITDAAGNYALQAIFFFLTRGEPFCGDASCRLFNAHWQEDLTRMLQKPALCQRHAEMADKFNRQLAEIKNASFQNTKEVFPSGRSDPAT